MKVSVLVTTYNNPFSLKKVLDGLAAQRRKPDEVLVADDGSGPETAGLVQFFSKAAPFPVQHMWQEDRGFRAAKIRNEAIKASSGDYLIIIDGDCVPDRHFVSDHLRLAEKGCFIQGKRIMVDKKTSAYFSPDAANSPFELLKIAISGGLSNIHHLMRLPFFPSFKNTNKKGIKSCNMSFFRADLIAVNGFNEAFEGWGNEDTELAVRLYKYGLTKKSHFFRSICFHLWHPSNKTPIKKNIALLEKAIKSENYFCEYGIIKKNPAL